jgi:hypothetical protein
MYGNVVTTSAARVTLTIASGNGTLACTPVSAVNGVATFVGCSITANFQFRQTQLAFTLQAAATGLTSTTSGSFEVEN